MEKGSLRCDANVSVRPKGQEEFGTKVEIKNLNSFRNMRRALEYEEVRQREELASGGRIYQETRLWNEALGVTQPMRSKEYAHDYRYFPEPDLIPSSCIESERLAIPRTHRYPVRPASRFCRRSCSAACRTIRTSISRIAARTARSTRAPRWRIPNRRRMTQQ